MSEQVTATFTIVGSQGNGGADGNPGQNGENSAAAGTGQDGKNGSCSFWHGGCKCATNGTAGAEAVSLGENGGSATNGDLAPTFTLTVGEFIFQGTQGPLYITSQGGNGGNGGGGGAGGAGAAGGTAGTNQDRCLNNGSCAPAQGGLGGNGKNGGAGGNGGDGGNGGILTVYYSSEKNIEHVVASSPSGAGGAFGNGGVGGKGGDGGKNEPPPGGEPSNAFPGDDGINPGDGRAGNNGDNGTVTLHKKQ